MRCIDRLASQSNNADVCIESLARRDSLVSRNAIYMKRNPQSGVASVSRNERERESEQRAQHGCLEFLSRPNGVLVSPSRFVTDSVRSAFWNSPLVPLVFSSSFPDPLLFY